jgi:aminoglycoside phosphotransferase (APT) family kinase protein
MNSYKPAPIGGKLLARIWKHHRLGGIRSLSQPSRPGLNSVRFVNDRYVIRFYTSEATRYPPSQGEAHAFKILANSGIPVPEVVALGFSGDISPYDYLIMSRLPGRPLIEVWPELDKRQRKRAANSTGVYLAQIHTHTFKRFGYLSRLESDGYSCWYDFLYDYFSHYAGRVERVGIIESGIIKRIQRLLQTNRPLLEQVTLGALLHSDFHFKHILYQAGEITGILDFEMALSGDPAWEFVPEDRWPQQCPGSLPWLFQQYQQRRTLESGYELRVSLYKLLMYLVFIADSKNNQAVDNLEEARTQMTGLIEMLEENT